MAQKVSPGGNVFLYEPVPSCHDAIRNDPRWSDYSGLMQLFPYALGNANGTTEFVVATDLLAYSGLKERVYDAPTGTENISVELRRLDDLFPFGAPNIAYIKVDAEGGEFDIFVGATRVFGRDRPLVSFEFGMNSASAYGTTPEMVFSFWRSLDYRLADILGRDTDREEFSASAYHQKVWDYLAIPEERHAETMDMYREILRQRLGE